MSAEPITMPDIDWEATNEHVKDALNRAREYIQMGFHPRFEASTTAGYSLVPPSETYQFRSSTENAAIRNADFEIMGREHVQKVFAAVMRLGKRERELIMTRWFGDEDLTDFEAYVDLNMAHATYYRVRAKAFRTLACSLRLTVFKDETN